MTITVDKFGRVLIPKALRDRLGLTPGTELTLDIHEGGDGAPALELRAVEDPNDPDSGLIRVDGRLVHEGRPTGDMDVARILREQYEARARRHAGLDLGDELEALPPLPLSEIVGSAPSGRTAEEVDRDLRTLREEWD